MNFQILNEQLKILILTDDLQTVLLCGKKFPQLHFSFESSHEQDIGA